MVVDESVKLSDYELQVMELALISYWKPIYNKEGVTKPFKIRVTDKKKYEDYFDFS